MNVIEVLRLPLAVDLSGFVKLLQRMQVPHRVSEEGEQVLWVPAISEDVRVLYNATPAAMPISNWPSGACARQRAFLVEQAMACKVTAAAAEPVSCGGLTGWATT
jgi:GlpG protein